MRVKLSILGLYNHYDDIFDRLVVPSTVDRNTVIHKILYDLAELSLVYTSADLVRDMIGVWSEAMLPSWERMAVALNAEYNPIHNYDRTEEWRDSTKESSSEHSESSGSSTEAVSGYNTGAGMADSSRNSGSNEQDRGQNREASSTRTGRAYGNIGVTTTMQMIREEMNLREDFNIYDVITQSFKAKFCVMVY